MVVWPRDWILNHGGKVTWSRHDTIFVRSSFCLLWMDKLAHILSKDILGGLMLSIIRERESRGDRLKTPILKLLRVTWHYTKQKPPPFSFLIQITNLLLTTSPELHNSAPQQECSPSLGISCQKITFLKNCWATSISNSEAKVFSSFLPTVWTFLEQNISSLDETN